jgi:Caspase domain
MSSSDNNIREGETMHPRISRREFVVRAALAPFVLYDVPAFAQTPTSKRAALVVGVDRPTGLQPLSAAASAASDVAQWLTGQRYEVVLRTDANGAAVSAEDLKKIVKGFVQRNNLTMLVVYFAGHGFVDGQGEYWLLSDAPEDTDATIDNTRAAASARRSNIPNVVIISDACRTMKDELKFVSVRGQDLFPASDSLATQDVDEIRGSHFGGATWEARVKTYESLFTRSLLKVYSAPPLDCTKNIGGVTVVTN